MRRVIFLFLASAILACTALRSQPLALRLGEEATLGIGATTAWSPDLNIRFVAVTEDSRCPIDATCVWAGRLRIQLEIKTTGKIAMHELIESEHVIVDDHRVTFVAGKPPRLADRTIDPKAYRATLRVDGMDQQPSRKKQ